jgi:hypothetical protein
MDFKEVLVILILRDYLLVYKFDVPLLELRLYSLSWIHFYSIYTHLAAFLIMHYLLLFVSDHRF